MSNPKSVTDHLQALINLLHISAEVDMNDVDILVDNVRSERYANIRRLLIN
jgi:hypothetical protein